MDVQLEIDLDGISAAVAIRRELPRLPVVFYSIQDDDAYYRAFRRAGILTHYAYVRKSNYLLPELIVPLLRDAVAGRGFVDAEIAEQVQEVAAKDEHAPLALLEPYEQIVARLLSRGLSNEQIAARLGFRDKRTISRVNATARFTPPGASTRAPPMRRSREPGPRSSFMRVGCCAGTIAAACTPLIHMASGRRMT